MAEKAQIAIIGGGVVGSAVACHLAWKGARDVIILEREALCGTQSTALCAGGVRAQFSSKVNVELQLDAIRQLLTFEEDTGVSPLFKQVGYLFLLGTQRLADEFQRNLEMQRGLGLEVERLSPTQARELAPVVQVDDVVAANYCATDGLADPNSVTMGYLQAAKTKGVKVLTSKEVERISVDNSFDIETADGERIEAEYVVNAAGAWSGEIGAMVGLDIPVTPYRRQIFTTAPLPDIPPEMPMVVDLPAGLYMHPESGGLLMGMADRNEPPSFQTHTDQDFMIRIFEAAMHRIPVLERAELGRGWGGLYETTPDEHAILGEGTSVPKFYVAAGFSGHGFMQAPAAGRIIAEMIVDGKTSIDVSSLSLERFGQGELLGPEIVI